MKKTLFFAAVAALFTLASCQKEETQSQNQGGDLVFTATIDSQDSKTTIDALTGKVSWVIGDEITISDCNSTAAKYSVTTIVGDTLATFTKVDGQPDLGEGPYDATYSPDFSSGQTYSATVPALPMSAHSQTTHLKFTVTCGLLELSLTAGESVTRIEVTGTPTGGTENIIIFKCSTPVSIASGAKFYIVLPEGSYTSFLIYGQNGAMCKKEKSGESIAIAANHITPVSFKSLHFAVQLWKNGPCWATTNIGADTPEAYGQYFAWGYTEGCVRNSDNTGWVLASDGTTVKTFNDNATTGFSGYTSHFYSDMATANWGAGWNVPTMTDFENLINTGTYTTIERVTSGTPGIRITGKGDYAQNSIFLPAAGYGLNSGLNDAETSGYYWSSADNGSYRAFFLDFAINYESYAVNYSYKTGGYPVRPVCSSLL